MMGLVRAQTVMVQPEHVVMGQSAGRPWDVASSNLGLLQADHELCDRPTAQGRVRRPELKEEKVSDHSLNAR